MNEKEYLEKAKKFLNQAKFVDTAINDKTEEKQRLTDLATKITSTYGGVPTCSVKKSNGIADILNGVVDLENDINNEIATLISLKQRISQAINTIPNIKHKIILNKKYLNFKTWEKIAEELNIDERWLRKLHNDILIENRNKLEKFF
ncbi:MAG: DUF1492 domain-containing protein [Oscillospiraceae bacterium]|nr:DUF1492 domain-containing protein [Oscillospiraceae bacterium]